jgi:hypothetical protein
VRPDACPSCGGTCCRDTARGTRVEHMGAAQYVHDCEACTGGTKHGAALLSALRERDLAWKALGEQVKQFQEVRVYVTKVQDKAWIAERERAVAVHKVKKAQEAQERLRKKLKALQQRILADADELASTSERHAVVLWLRNLECGLNLEGNPAAARIGAAADLIERGDHLTGDGSDAPKPPENDPPKTPSGA